MRSATPAAAERSVASSRMRRFATTPPPSSSRGTPRSRQAASALVDQHVGDRLAEARRDLARRHRIAGFRAASTRRATAVFSPENEKS